MTHKTIESGLRAVIKDNADHIISLLRLGWNAPAAIANQREKSTLGEASWVRVLALVDEGIPTALRSAYRAQMAMTPEASEKKHTPLPWFVTTLNNNWPGICSATGNNDKPFTNVAKTDCSITYGGSTSCEAAKANAQLIVTPVNQHEALLTACQAALVNLKDARANGLGQGAVIEQVTAAIAAATQEVQGE